MVARVSRSVWWACAVSAAAGILLYFNTLDCGLCFDDEAAIKNNQDLRPNSSWSNLLWDDFWGNNISDRDSHKSYRPLCVATFRLNYLWHGLSPMGYHVVNVVLHAVVCYLYVQLCALIFNSVWPALLAGLLFAAHPIHTEAVAGVVGRADVMAALFCASAMLLYRPTASSGSGLLVTMATCLASALSKEIGVASFILCPLYEYLIRRRMTVQSTVIVLKRLFRHVSPTWFLSFLRRSVVLAVCCAVFVGCRFLLNQGAPVFSVHNNPALGFRAPYRQLHWMYLVYYNLMLLAFPSSLSAEVALNTIPPISSLTDLRNGLTVLAFSSLALLTWRAVARKDSTLMFALALMAVPFLPASNLFFPVGFVVAERVLYLPSMGFCLLVAIGWWRLHRVYPVLTKLLLGYLLFCHSCKTVVRNRAWHSSFDLFRAAVVTAPNNAKMFNNLATEVDEVLGNKTQAVQLFRHAVHVEPHFITAAMNLAYNLRLLDEMDEALEVYQAASDLVTRGMTVGDVHVTPKNVKVYNSLSNMLREHAHDPQGALKYALKAIEVEPDWENGYHSKANALVELGRPSEARVAFEKAVQINPDFAMAHSNYGDLLSKLNLVEEAEDHLQRSLQIDRNHTLTKFRTAAIIIKLPHPSRIKLLQAEELLLEVLRKEPENGNATFNLAVVYFDLGRHDDAEVFYKKALSISPTDKGSLYNLGILLTEKQRFSEAIEYLSQIPLHHPDDPSGHAQLATCYMQVNQTDLARQGFQKTLNLDPNDIMALNNYGYLSMKEGQAALALQLFSRLADLQPANLPVKRQVEALKQKLNDSNHNK